MRSCSLLIPLVLATALGACAKPPQADVDAAKASVAAAAENADIVTYAADTLKAAEDELSRMQAELDAKHYDKVKSQALEARVDAEKAADDAARGKERAQADATSLIGTLDLPCRRQKRSWLPQGRSRV